MQTSSVNVDLIKLADDRLAMLGKQSFIPQGDPVMTGGDPAAGGAMPPGPPMDPAMMGGAMPPGAMPPGPPMDPAMMDPAMMGGAMPPGPPMDPSMMGAPPAPPTDPMADIQPMIQKAVEEAMAGQGGGGGGGGGKSKAKADVGAELAQLKHMMAKVVDAIGIPMSAQEMMGPPAEEGGGEGAPAPPPADPAMGGAPPAMGGGGGLAPMDPMQPMAPAKMASQQEGAFGYSASPASNFQSLGSRASALMAIRKQWAGN